MTALAAALTAALLHFLWQGLVVAFALFVVLFLLRKNSANARYVANCVALAILSVLPVITVWMVFEPLAGIHAGANPAGAATIPQTVTRTWTSAFSGGVAWIPVLNAWALPAWAVGVFLFSLRLLFSCGQIAALRREGAPAETSVQALIESLAERMRISRPVRVLISSIAEGPSVIGHMRPVILLPAATIIGLTPLQLEAILAHELAHLRRHDYLVNLFQMVVETLLFYHPAVWWISGRIRHERELCCDDLAVRSCGDALCYARALTKLEKLRVMKPTLAVGSTDGPLIYRIRRLIAQETPEYGPSRLTGAFALFFGFACLTVNLNWATGRTPGVESLNPAAPTTIVTQLVTPAQIEPLRSLPASSGHILEDAPPRPLVLRVSVTPPPPLTLFMYEPPESMEHTEPSPQIGAVRIGDVPTIPNGIVTPPQVIRSSYPSYTDEARNRGIEGIVTVEAEFDIYGDFRVLRVLKGLGFGLDENAVAVLRDWRFSPAVRNGSPVPVIARIDIAFILQNDWIHVGPGVSPPSIIHRVEPQFPEEARSQRLMGTVVLECIVRKDGTPQVVRLVKSSAWTTAGSEAGIADPGTGMVFFENAAKAIEQWKFSPALLNGEAVNVTLNVEVNFSLR